MFSHSMKYLKDEALKVICQRTGDVQFNVNDIQWVLTVPAIWTPVAKQFMREAAYEVSCWGTQWTHYCFAMSTS